MPPSPSPPTRRPKTSVLVALASACAALLLTICAACAGDGNTPSAPSSPIVGLLTSIELTPEGEIRSIVVQPESGADLAFIVELTDPASVGGAHPQEHLDQRWPVSVTFGGSGDRLVAYAIDDAPE